MGGTLFGCTLPLIPDDQLGVLEDEPFPYALPEVIQSVCCEECYPNTIDSWTENTLLMIDGKQLHRFRLLQTADGEPDQYEVTMYDMTKHTKTVYTVNPGETTPLDQHDLSTISGLLSDDEAESRFELRKIPAEDNAYSCIYTFEPDLPPCSPEDFEIENGMLVKYLKSGGDVVIPDEVTAVSEFAFQFCDKPFRITWPKHIPTLGYAHFRGTPLVDIHLPEGVTTIGVGAFSCCQRLKKIALPSTITSIGADAFSHSALTHITIPEGVTAIAPGAFSWCSQLKEVTLPSTITSIGANAFEHCTALTRINLPEGVAVGDGAFKECFGLADEQGFVMAGGVLHAYCGEEASITVPDSITAIGSEAFQYNSTLTEVILPDSVTTVGENAFIRCAQLTSVTLSNSSVTLGANAFSMCFQLKNLTIPQGATIGNGAFASCHALADEQGFVVVNGTVCDYGGNDTVPALPNGITTIGSGAFSNNPDLTDLTIPEGVTTIGCNAFQHCENLTTVTLPHTLIAIGESAFEGCSALTDLTIPEGVTTIEDHAFAYCENLGVVPLPSTATAVSDTAFTCEYPNYCGDEIPF